jgi:O-antigen ligase
MMMFSPSATFFRDLLRPLTSGGPRVETLLAWLLVLHAAFLPISIAMAQPLALAAVVIWLVRFVLRGKSLAWRSPFLLPIVLFSLWVLVSSFGWSVRPEASLSKLHRLALLFMPLAMVDGLAGRAASPRAAAWLAGLAFIAGAAALGAYDLVRVPLQVLQGARLFDTGNMRDPQLHMTAACLALGATIVYGGPAISRFLTPALLLTLGGVVLHFKRGVWLACLLSVLFIVLLARRRMPVIWVALVVAGLLAVPQVRHRMEAIRQETMLRQGGRKVLWTTVAPQLLRQYPQGMGYLAVRNTDLAEHARYVQPKLNHLHNNLLQVALELGWIGLALWLAWMARIVRVHGQLYRPALAGDADRLGLVVGCFGAFTGLMLNGLVEYNFGDSEIMMTLCVIMGIAGLLYEDRRPQRTS